MASRHSTGYSLLIGQELVFEHEYAVGVRHMHNKQEAFPFQTHPPLLSVNILCALK